MPQDLCGGLSPPLTLLAKVFMSHPARPQMSFKKGLCPLLDSPQYVELMSLSGLQPSGVFKRGLPLFTLKGRRAGIDKIGVGLKN